MRVAENFEIAGRTGAATPSRAIIAARSAPAKRTGGPTGSSRACRLCNLLAGCLRQAAKVRNVLLCLLLRRLRQLWILYWRRALCLLLWLLRRLDAARRSLRRLLRWRSLLSGRFRWSSPAQVFQRLFVYLRMAALGNAVLVRKLRVGTYLLRRSLLDRKSVV